MRVGGYAVQDEDGFDCFGSVDLCQFVLGIRVIGAGGVRCTGGDNVYLVQMRSQEINVAL